MYNIQIDPFCLHNLSADANLQPVREKLKNELEHQLTIQGDPRILGTGDIFDSYPRFGKMRSFDGFKQKGKYNPQFNKQ